MTDDWADAPVRRGGEYQLYRAGRKAARCREPAASYSADQRPAQSRYRSCRPGLARRRGRMPEKSQTMNRTPWCDQLVLSAADEQGKRPCFGLLLEPAAPAYRLARKFGGLASPTSAPARLRPLTPRAWTCYAATTSAVKPVPGRLAQRLLSCQETGEGARGPIFNVTTCRCIGTYRRRSRSGNPRCPGCDAHGCQRRRRNTFSSPGGAATSADSSAELELAAAPAVSELAAQ